MSAPSSTTLHLLGHFNDQYTGAESELLDIRTLVAGRRPVKLWSDVPPHAAHAGKGVIGVKPFARQFPSVGVLLVAGVHVGLDIWLKYTRFERVILLYNLASHERLFARIEQLRELTECEPELVFVSTALQLSVGLPGRVINSVIDLQPFLAIDRAATPVRPFTVGRLSRDIEGKHHAQDASLYRMLAARGVLVRIMGGTCLAAQLAGVDGVELLPAGALAADKFLRNIDLFFYRTGASVEAYGRVVVEAMAAGLPVVAGATGGYAEVIRPGVTGVLVNSQEQAFDAIMAASGANAPLVQRGAVARQDAISRHGPAANELLIRNWLLS